MNSHKLGVSENVVYYPKPNGFHDPYPVFKWLAIIGKINPIHFQVQTQLDHQTRSSGMPIFDEPQISPLDRIKWSLGPGTRVIDMAQHRRTGAIDIAAGEDGHLNHSTAIWGTDVKLRMCTHLET